LRESGVAGNEVGTLRSPEKKEKKEKKEKLTLFLFSSNKVLRTSPNKEILLKRAMVNS
jgi:hypothetical protein